MKYKLNIADLRNFKARITEHLIQQYLEKTLKPRFEEDGGILFFKKEAPFDIFQSSCFFYPIHFKDKNFDWEEAFLETRTESIGEKKIISGGQWHISNKRERKKLVNQWRAEKETEYRSQKKKIYFEFLQNECFPDPELIDKCMMLSTILLNRPDGIIYKLDKTGKKISKSEVQKEVETDYYLRNLSDKILLVNGTLEIVEVKSDTGFISGNQFDSYHKAIDLGFPLHYFHVFVYSYVDNDFEIEETIIQRSDMLKPHISKYLKKSRIFSKRRKTRRAQTLLT